MKICSVNTGINVCVLSSLDSTREYIYMLSEYKAKLKHLPVIHECNLISLKFSAQENVTVTSEYKSTISSIVTSWQKTFFSNRILV